MTNTEPRLSSLAQERSRRTYRSLLDAADKLFVENGFDETTVSDICEAAGVAKGTFYFYFPRKEDLLLELSMSGLDVVQQEVAEWLSDETRTAEEVLFDTLENFARRATRRPKHLVRRVSEETLRASDRFDQIRGDHPSYTEILEPIFVTALERDELPRGYRAPELSSMLGWVMVQAVHGWSADALGNISLAGFLKRRAAIVWNGAKSEPPPR